MSIIGNASAERALAEKTRTAFNEAAIGKAEPSNRESSDRPDKATHDYNLEPSMAEKRQGAAQDMSSAQRLFEKQKAKERSAERGGPQLGR